MSFISRRSFAVQASVAVLALAFAPRAAFAQSDPAVAQVQGFYDGLVASMKLGGSAKGRYDKLRPVVEKAFDLPAMTAVAVGPTWASIPAADQKALTEAFTRMTVANYAKNFDSFHGEQFTVVPEPVARGTEKLVRSSMKTSSETIAFNYRVHQAGGDWKVTDVFLAGNISQMAQKRADFAGTLSASGPQGLVKRMNSLTDQMLG